MKKIYNGDFGLVDKVALVTGASRGIGFAISKALAMSGVKVMMIARSGDELIKSSKDIRDLGGDVDFLIGDVMDPVLPDQVLSRVYKNWGFIDILVNNAGGPPMGTFLEFDSLEWSSAFQKNLLACVRFTQAVSPAMKERKWGRIISISSTVAKEPSPQMVLSATVRAGLSAFTKAVSTELAKYNITVNVICPGGVLTDRLESLINAQAIREGSSYNASLKNAQTSIPLGRFASPDEVANVALFLASSFGSYITGVSLSVDGGLSKGYF